MAVDDFVSEGDLQRVVFGWGRFGEVVDECDRLGVGRILLMAERSTSRLADAAVESLGGRVVARIDGMRAHVPGDEAEEARRLARASSVDAVLTIGGGSATGLGKAVTVEVDAALISVPTTYAGSEMTPVYGVTVGGRKRTQRDDRALPTLVLYDPALTTSLPPRATATTGMNAIAHCVEGLYAESPDVSIERDAALGIEMLAKALPICVRRRDDRFGRTNALFGAHLGGRVIAGAGMAIHHRICHVLGGTFGLGHGDANAVVLPHVVAFNASAAPAALDTVANALGTDDAASGLYDLVTSLGAPKSLKELGMSDDDLPDAARIVFEADFYNPRPATVADVTRILERAWAGGSPSRDEAAT
jgi:maleylacetate reductase